MSYFVITALSVVLVRTRVSATSFHLPESFRQVGPSGPQQAAIERAESQLAEGARLSRSKNSKSLRCSPTVWTFDPTAKRSPILRKCTAGDVR